LGGNMKVRLKEIEEKAKELRLKYQDPEGRIDRIPGNVEIKIEWLERIIEEETKKRHHHF